MKHRETGQKSVVKIMYYEKDSQAFKREHTGVRLAGRSHAPRELAVDQETKAIALERGLITLEESILEGDCSLATVVLALAQVARSLHQLHRAGVSHGNLHPSHVMRFQESGGEDVWKLISFGESRKLGDVVEGHARQGTGFKVMAPYRAPEIDALQQPGLGGKLEPVAWTEGGVPIENPEPVVVKSGIEITPSLDMWSMGMLLYFAATRQEFPSGEDVSVSEVLADLPDVGILTSTIKSLLSIDPLVRPTAKELAEDLIAISKESFPMLLSLASAADADILPAEAMEALPLPLVPKERLADVGLVVLASLTTLGSSCDLDEMGTTPETSHHLYAPAPADYYLRVRVIGRPGCTAATVSRLSLAISEQHDSSSLAASPDIENANGQAIGRARRDRSSCLIPVAVKDDVDGSRNLTGRVTLYVDLCELPHRGIEIQIPLQIKIREPLGADVQHGHGATLDWVSEMGYGGRGYAAYGVMMEKLHIALQEQELQNGGGDMLEID